MKFIESLGAGNLTARLYRRDDQSYCFNIADDDGQNELEHLIQLLRLIAWHIDHDGHSSPERRDYVRFIYQLLQEVSQQ